MQRSLGASTQLRLPLSPTQPADICRARPSQRRQAVKAQAAVRTGAAPRLGLAPRVMWGPALLRVMEFLECAPHSPLRRLDRDQYPVLPSRCCQYNCRA